MVRRVTPSQFQSMLRQQQQRQRQAVDKYNREVRAYNQKINEAINNYNQRVRAHNARVRANQQRLRSELTRLSRQPTTVRYTTLRVSVGAVHSAYERLETAADLGRFDERHDEMLDLSEREAANNAGLMNALLGDAASAEVGTSSPESHLTPRLLAMSSDLADRWRGAIFSLNPQNPDAARHFCTSAREIITRILDTKALDADVVAAIPNCQRTPNGTPSRRAKIRYLLQRAGTPESEIEDFVDADMNNIVELFQAFNDGTHGSAGTFGHGQLTVIRKRVEDGIEFLLKVIR